jgi:hypothetical protein
MARTNNRRNKQKVQQGRSPTPSSNGGGVGKDKKSIPAKKAKVFGKKKKAPAHPPPFARNGTQPGLKQGIQHRLQAKEKAGGAKKGGRQQEFRFHLLSINTTSSSYSYQKAPWKSSTAARPSTIHIAEPGTSGAASVDSANFQLSSPRNHGASRTDSGDNSSRRSICSRLSSGPLPTEGIPPQLLNFLDQELEQFGDFVRLTPVEVQARHRVAGAVQRAAAQQYSGAQVQPFGYVVDARYTQ